MFKNLNLKNSFQISNFKFQIGIGLLVYSFIGLFVIFPKHVFAQNISLGIYPPIIQIDTTPPAQIRSPFTIINHSDSTINADIIVRPFTSSESDNGQPQYLQGPQDFADPDIFGRMSIFDGSEYTNLIILAPQQKRNMELQINLPREEPSGDYYFSIILLSKPIKNSQGTGTAVAGGLSTNVLLSIGPKDTTSGYIKEFSSPFLVDHGPIAFTLHVANTSKHFIYPTGRILIKNIFGQTIGNVDLRQDNILAGTSRYLQDNVQSSVASRKSSALVRPTANDTRPALLWNEKFLLGPYAASLTLQLSNEGPIYHMTIYFFAIPFQMLIGIILGIILVGIVVYRVRKRLK